MSSSRRTDAEINRERSARVIFINRVREYMRDHAELNTLFEGEENSDRLIEHSVERILEDYMATPPVVGRYQVYDFPDHSLLIDGVVGDLLMSAAILLNRNDLDFSSGSMQVSTRQAQMYLQLAQMHQQRYEQRKARLKVAANHDQAVRSVQHIDSDFARVHGSGYLPGH